MFRLCPYNNTESTINRETIPCNYNFCCLKIKKCGGFLYFAFRPITPLTLHILRRKKLWEGLFGAILMLILGY